MTPTSKQPTEDANGARAIRALKAIYVILPILAGIVAAHYSTRYALEMRLNEVETDAKHFDRHLRQLEAASVSHWSSGPDGLRHPAGTTRIIRELERRIITLEKKKEAAAAK